MKPKELIGRRDRIDLPDLNLLDIEAKIDTGAYTSAIHCSQVRLFVENGVRQISFHILDARHPDVEKREFVTRYFKKKKIKNSFGHSESRFVIKTKIIIFGRVINTEFSLSDRAKMRFPILLGRKLLRNKFIVDVSLRDLSFARKTNDSQLF